MPRDTAILSLARKPHQGPVTSPVDIGVMTEEEEDRQMLAYLEKWTKRYFVDGSDIQLKPGNAVPSLAGEDEKIAFTEDDSNGGMDWQRVLVQPGAAKIVAAREVRSALYRKHTCTQAC